MESVPKFLYSQHPRNKYDPPKLYSIWTAKLSAREERHQEMMKLMIDDLYKASDDINENYKTLKEHINRVQKSNEKYGK